MSVCTYVRPFFFIIFLVGIRGGGGPTYGGKLMHAVFENAQPMLIVRSPVLEFRRAYLVTPAADSKFLRIKWYLCTYKKYMVITILKIIPVARIHHVKFFS